MKHLVKSRALVFLVLAAFVLSTSGCATMMYPDRKPEDASDRVDPKPYLLDCLLIIPGIIPGAVALIIDFSNKKIYYSKQDLVRIGNEILAERARKAAEAKKEAEAKKAREPEEAAQEE